jgi:hypothetical protein
MVKPPKQAVSEWDVSESTLGLTDATAQLTRSCQGAAIACFVIFRLHIESVWKGASPQFSLPMWLATAA